jgi:N-acetylmuramoyl-L-alanine amidase
MKVFIDPGHGGEDPGAVGPTGYMEKEFNLRTATLLELACQWRGWDTFMSRNQDFNVGERDSAIKANIWEADVYVSIHANGGPNHAGGCEILYWNTSSRSRLLAREVQTQILHRLPWLRDRGLKPKFPGDRGATILRRTEMPAILVEPMFVTNPSEEQALRRFGTQAQIADAIIESVDLWV